MSCTDNRMDELRWILLIVGGVVIAAIYLWGVRGEIADRFRKPVRLPEHHDPDLFSDSDLERPDTRCEPGLGLGPESGYHTSVPGGKDPELTSASGEDDSERMNLVVTILARDNVMLGGEEIERAAAQVGLHKGKRGTLECYPDDSARGTPVFSLATVLEPGVFDWSNMAELNTPGLVCFMPLPGPVEGRSAFELLLSVTQRLAESLDAVLCDDRRLRLSQQSIEHLRTEVSDFERRRHLESLRRQHG